LQLSEEQIQQIREQIKEYNFKAGIDDYKVFIDSPVWDDFKCNILDRILSIQQKLESLENSREADIVYKGRLHELRQLLEYPIKVIQLLEVLEEQEDEQIEDDIV
jgi:hypothetical protein